MLICAHFIVGVMVMADKIKLGIVGYGNLGRGVEKAVAQNPDMELVAIFTRRKPDEIKATVPV